MRFSRTIRMLPVALAALSFHAWGDQASADIDVSVQVTRVMTLDCTTPLGFGITTLGTGRTESSEITLDPANSSLAITAGGTDAVTLGSGQAAQCELKGSQHTSELVFTGTEDSGGAPVTSFDLAGGSVYNLSAPTTEATVSVKDVDSENFTITNGEASFNVGGTLVVPATMTDDNLGAYTGSVVFFVEDGV